MSNEKPVKRKLPTSLTVAINSPSSGEDPSSTSSTQSKTILKVPTPLLTNDNTPTPVRALLRDFEANESVFTGFRANPFDEDFRKATQDNTKKSNKSTTPQVDDVLNTPQNIVFSDLTTPSLSNTATVLAVNEGSNVIKKSPRIAPKIDGSGVTEQAQLMIRLNSGQDIHFATMPVLSVNKVLESDTSSASAIDVKANLKASLEKSKTHPEKITKTTQNLLKKTAQSYSNNVPKNPPEDQDKKIDMLERNREAAKRFRAKRKRENEEKSKFISDLSASNKYLSKENELLKNELIQLKSILEKHIHCPITLENNQSELISKIIQPITITFTPTTNAEIQNLPILKKKPN